VYIPPSATHQTWTEADKGTPFILRAGSGNNIEPTFYYSWKMPGDTGGDFYRDNISGCNTSSIPMNSPMVQEPGNMMGPTIQGVQMLLDQDPSAYWDGSKVVSPSGRARVCSRFHCMTLTCIRKARPTDAELTWSRETGWVLRPVDRWQ
jgi:hypothetical protein